MHYIISKTSNINFCVNPKRYKIGGSNTFFSFPSVMLRESTPCLFKTYYVWCSNYTISETSNTNFYINTKRYSEKVMILFYLFSLAMTVRELTQCLIKTYYVWCPSDKISQISHTNFYVNSKRYSVRGSNTILSLSFLSVTLRASTPRLFKIK